MAVLDGKIDYNEALKVVGVAKVDEGSLES
jgi:hypothetical protein